MCAFIFQYDLLQLRKYFNKKFDALMNEKKAEMNLVKERNKRLLYIQGELNVLADIDGSASVHSEIINDPEFLPDEVPETIVQVRCPIPCGKCQFPINRLLLQTGSRR